MPVPVEKRLHRVLALRMGESDTERALRSPFAQTLTFGFEAEVATAKLPAPLDTVALKLEKYLANRQFRFRYVEIQRGHNASPKSPKFWYVEPDSSIEPQGVEIVSPVESGVLGGLAMLDVVLDFFAANRSARDDGLGLHTNDSTGLHVGIGHPSWAKGADIDLLKLLMFVGDEYVLDTFDRLNNEYAAPYIEYLQNSAYVRGRAPNDVIERTNRYLLDQTAEDAKYRSVNVAKLRHGYLEFRIAGGANYDTDEKRLRATIGRYVRAVYAATHREYQRADYLKRVYSLFSSPRPAVIGDAKLAAGFTKKDAENIRDMIASVTGGMSDSEKTRYVGLVQTLSLSDTKDFFIEVVYTLAWNRNKLPAAWLVTLHKLVTATKFTWRRMGNTAIPDEVPKWFVDLVAKPKTGGLTRPPYAPKSLHDNWENLIDWSGARMSPRERDSYVDLMYTTDADMLGRLLVLLKKAYPQDGVPSGVSQVSWTRQMQALTNILLGYADRRKLPPEVKGGPAWLRAAVRHVAETFDVDKRIVA